MSHAACKGNMPHVEPIIKLTAWSFFSFIFCAHAYERVYVFLCLTCNESFVPGQVRTINNTHVSFVPGTKNKQRTYILNCTCYFFVFFVFLNKGVTSRVFTQNSSFCKLSVIHIYIHITPQSRVLQGCLYYTYCTFVRTYVRRMWLTGVSLIGLRIAPTAT